MTAVLKEVTNPPLRTHLIGFKFTWNHFCPTYTVGNLFSHLYKLCSQISNSLSVRYLSPNDVPQTQEPEWDEQIYQALANLLRQKRTAITREEKVEFLNYWEKASHKSYTKTQ